MIIVLKPNIENEDLNHILTFIKEQGLESAISKGKERTIINIIGDSRILYRDQIELFTGVEKVLPILSEWKLVSRDFHPKNTIINIDGVKIGGDKIVVMAGPCAVENEEQLLKIAKQIKKAGAKVLRASAFKPRTSPYAFQGLGKKGLEIIKKVKQKTGLITETEITNTKDINLVSKNVDIFRVGARNTQNYDLLKKLGKSKKPIILKNGVSTTLKEFLLAAEYIMSEGNQNIILCLRGIRTYETATRNTLDLGLISIIKQTTHLPVIVDPSHAAGTKEGAIALARAAIAAGADGLLIEVHNDPKKALSDAKQALTITDFNKLMSDLKKIAPVVNKRL